MTHTNVTITGDMLVVEPQGLDKMWSFTRRLTIPLEHVRGATHDPGMRQEHKGRRGPGLHLPGKLAGTFHADGECQFWNVSDFAQTVVVQLDPAEHFTRLVISVDDAPHAVDAINAAISS
ncbi:MAG: hypothetical protein M3Y49_18270 [Actinomycetota bacterium]|nr:hypothetical protein [Actinomycetota bacterium]